MINKFIPAKLNYYIYYIKYITQKLKYIKKDYTVHKKAQHNTARTHTAEIRYI